MPTRRRLIPRYGEAMQQATFGVDGVRVGHWTDEKARTGCTVVDLPAGTVGCYEMRGGAPASREVTVLEPDKTVAQVEAVLLTGGSAFGLAAADGVMRWCEEAGRGVGTPAGPVPIVPAMALFDLAVGDTATRPGAEEGYAAAAATLGPQVLRGAVGAGCGAMTGQWRGPDGRRPGGLGHAVFTHGDVRVAALVAVNAFGDVDPGGAEIATDALAVLDALGEADHPDAAGREHTTIGVVVTNARLDKTGCRIVAQGAHDGLARALTPPHTRFDGDGLIALATGQIDPPHLDVVRLLALAATATAVRSVGEI